MGLKKFLARFRPAAAVDAENLPIEGELPEFDQAALWINSPPLSKKLLAGKVVLVDFWTHSCVNCLRTLPRLRDWHKTYSDRGLVIVGVHTPEFGFEKDPNGVREAVRRLGIEYPVVLDNDYVLWNRYRNHYWPAHYFIDARGRVRYHHFGEGGYENSEAVIRSLLKEAGTVPTEMPRPARPSTTKHELIKTPETYLGFDRLEYLGSPESVKPGVVQRYSVAKEPALNVFYLGGDWKIDSEYAVPLQPGARLVLRFAASQVNLVMQGTTEGSRVVIRLNGRLLGEEDRGADVGRDGTSTVVVKEGRMYNLVDSGSDYSQKILELTFADPGAELYAFTFG